MPFLIFFFCFPLLFWLPPSFLVPYPVLCSRVAVFSYIFMLYRSYDRHVRTFKSPSCLSKSSRPSAMKRPIENGGDTQQPAPSEIPPTIPASSNGIAPLNYGLTTCGLFGLSWGFGCTALSVLVPPVSLWLPHHEIDIYLDPPAFTPRRFFRRGVRLAAFVLPLACIMAVTDSVSTSPPPSQNG